MENNFLYGIIAVLAVMTAGLGWALWSLNQPPEFIEEPFVTIEEKIVEDEVVEENVIDEQTTGVVINVHIEPTSNPKETLEHWRTVQSIVELSDDYEMKLSLHFSPSVAKFVAGSAENLDLVRSWEANGHEIAAHHHDPSHVEWDGYTNNTSRIGSRDYKGTVDELLEIVTALTADGEILVGSGTKDGEEWPEGVIYGSAGGSPPSYEDLVGPAYQQTMGETEVTFVTKAPFGVGMISASSNATYEHIAEALEFVRDDEYLGLTLTNKTFTEETLADLEQVYQLFVVEGIQTQTIENLLAP